MFRVSSKQVYLSSETYIMKNSSKLNELNHKISTGKKVEKGSDDPVSKRKIMHEYKLLKEAETYKKNNSEAMNQLEEAETAIEAIHDTLDAVKVLTLQMANDTVSEEDREIARTQVLQAMEDIISYANTEIDGFYIFGGYRTSQAPFLEDGTYQGDEFTRELEIAPSVYKQVAFPGSEVLLGIENGVQTGINVFDTLTQLAEDLLNNDGEEISDRIDELDQSLEQTSRAQTESGALLQEVEISRAILETDMLSSDIRKSDLEDIDVSSAISDFSMLKTSLETTMATSSQVLKLSLLNYLR